MLHGMKQEVAAAAQAEEIAALPRLRQQRIVGARHHVLPALPDAVRGRGAAVRGDEGAAMHDIGAAGFAVEADIHDAASVSACGNWPAR
jgi:hypothetical protein